MNELFSLTALQLGARIKAGEVSIPEVTALSLDRAEENPNNAYLTVTRDRAMARAEALQKGVTEGGPLYGVPMAVKDNICVDGVRATCASRMLADFVPPYTATAVERLEKAGGVLIGKTNLDEFAMGSTGETSYFGPVTHPLHPDRSPGGSSSGSAAAVAEGSCRYALGSDTGGSVRLPAAHCGLTGIKPTYGTVSRYGLVAYASSLDQIGPLCADAADCAAVLDIIRGYDGRDATGLRGDYPSLLENLTEDIRGLRVGLPRECFGAGADPAVYAAVRSAAERLRRLGAEVAEISLPVMEYMVPAYYAIACAEASSNLARYDGVRYGHRAEGCASAEELFRKSRSEGFGGEVRRRILLGTFVLSAGYYDEYYKKALAAREKIKAAYRAAFAHCDVLLTPVSPAAAPRLGEKLPDPRAMYWEDIYTVGANLAGLPALSTPWGADGEGLPVGVQLIGPPLGEQTLLNAAHALEKSKGVRV